MLCERVLGRVDEEPFASRVRAGHEDPLEIDWWAWERRALRKATRGGRDVRLLLPLGCYIAPGDVLWDDGSTMVVARPAPCEVLIVRPRDARAAALVALEVGNLHAPAEVKDDEIRVVPDGPVEAVLREMSVSFTVERRPFVPRRCAGMPVVRIAPTLEISRG